MSEASDKPSPSIADATNLLKTSGWRKIQQGITTVASLMHQKETTDKPEDNLLSRNELWWSIIREADIEKVKEFIQRTSKKILYVRGAFGDIALHTCFLYNTPKHMELARFFIKEYPDLATIPSSGPEYNGENILHKAIVNKNKEMVHYLVDHFPDLLKGRADGAFFQKGHPCYFGEYPLGFAACTNQKDLVTFLIDRGADLALTDSNGNTIPHLLVMHELPDMFDYVEELWKQHPESHQSIWKITNHDGLTPLTMTAASGNVSMFNHLLEKRKQVQWSYGPVQCQLYPLDDLEGPKGALNQIVDAEQVDLLMLPRVIELLRRKWENFGSAEFYFRLKYSLLYLLAFTFSTIIRGEPGEWSLLSFVLDLFVVSGALWKFSREFRELTSSGLDYFSGSGAMFLENTVSITFCPLVLLAIFLKYVGVASADAFMTPLPVLAWSYMLFFFLGFPLTGPFVVMIQKMIKTDVLRFSMLYSVFLVGFSQSFHILLDKPGMYGFFEVAKLCFSVVTGEVELSDFIGNRFYALNMIFVVLFTIVAGVILLNLLIAMFGDTFSKISEDADKQWHLEWARIILSIQNELGDDLEKDERYKYWITIDNVRYIQVMEKNTSYLSS